MIKLLQIPSTWGEASQHWIWAAEMLARHMDRNKFQVDVTLDQDWAKTRYDNYDLIHHWYTTKVPDGLPMNKAVIVAHSRMETGCLGWKDVAGRGVVSQYLYDYIHGQEEVDYKLHVVNYGIDTDFWKPLPKRPSKKIRVGWMGDPPSKELAIAEAAIKFAPDVEFIPIDFSKEHRALYGMPNYYNSIDVLLVSTLEEGFYRPALEAASCGIAVVATDVGAVKEMVGEVTSIEGYKFCSPPEEIPIMKDKIARNLGERLNALTMDEIIRQGKHNRQFVCDNWTWEKKIGAWERMFEEAYEASK